MANVYEKLLTVKEERGGGFLLLIDPERSNEGNYLTLAENAEQCGVDGLLVGTSFMMDGRFAEAVADIKARTSVPVILFPGSYTQINSSADAILYTSLISGRNPQYLIDEQVKGAPLIRASDLETIPTGYMLIESGALTSVQFISGTLPIPRSKPDIACAHALAAQYLGMKAVYLEAGSGADMAVPTEMVALVKGTIEIPLLVGGGLRTDHDCSAMIAAGADFVVMGTRLENDPQLDNLRALTAATHPNEAVKV